MMHKQRAALLVAAIVSLMIVPLSWTFAQDTGETPAEDERPLYVDFCLETRLADGSAEIQTGLQSARDQLNNLQRLLDANNSGNLTFLEGIAQAEAALTSWDATQKSDCMPALDRDITRIYMEVLVAMLYGQMLDQTNSSNHLANAISFVQFVRTSLEDAQLWLDTPLPDPAETPDPEATVEVTDIAPTETPATELREAGILNPLLQSELLDNGISLLRDAEIVFDPLGASMTINLERFQGGDSNMDLANTLFTLDRLALILSDWPELAELATIILNTYDGENVVLVVGVVGDDFRAHYSDGSITKDEFTARLAVQTTP